MVTSGKHALKAVEITRHGSALTLCNKVTVGFFLGGGGEHPSNCCPKLQVAPT